jgi:hypothetical protein
MGVRVYICGHLQSLQLRANRSLLRRKSLATNPALTLSAITFS